MESFNFELRLVDAVSATAKKIDASVKKIDASATQTQAKLNKGFANIWTGIGMKADMAAFKQHRGFADSFTKIGAASERAAAKQQKAFSDSWVKIGTGASNQLARVARIQERMRQRKEAKHERDAEKAEEHSLLGGVKEGLGFNRIASAAFVGSFLAEGAMKIGESFIEGASKAVEMITEGVSRAFEAAGHEQKTRLQYKLSLGGKEGKEALEDAERFSKFTKFTPEQIAPTMLKLRRAGFEQKAARSIFATGADIEAAGGMSTTEYGDFAEHLKLKGGVNTKQLVSAGLDAPKFFKDLGKKLGISATAAEKRAGEGGKIDPQLMLNMIQQGVEKKQGGAAGTGGIADSQRLESRWEKIQALPDQFLKKLVDSPGFSRAEEMLVGLLEKLDPDSPGGKRIQASLESMFDKITGLIGDPDDAAEGLSSTIEQVVHLVGEVIDAAHEMADAFLPSLNTIEDMVIGLREAVAIQTGDKAGLQAALQQEAEVSNRRAAYAVEKISKMGEKFNAQNVTAHANDNGALMAPPIDLASHILAAQQGSNVISDKPRGGDTGKGGKVIHLTMAPGAVVVYAAPGETPSSHHRRTGEAVRRHFQDALESASTEGGG